MRRLLISLTAIALVLVSVSLVAAAPGPKLQTFGTGTVSVGTEGGASAIIDNDAGEYGGVYLNSKSQSGKLLNNVTFAFTNRGDVAGGAPRFSLPINDGDFDVNTDYAFIDAAGCGALVGPNPTGIATDVSTQNPACHVNFHGTDYANWAAFAAANPTYKIMAGYIPFIIADQAGHYVVTHIVLK
jgi:hypothetical protein